MNNEPPILNYNHPKNRNNISFSSAMLIPLTILIVVVILCQLFLPKIGGGPSSGGTRRKATIYQISDYKSALTAFAADTGRFPTTAEGLGALLHKPTDTPSWRGPYIDEILPDKWGHPFIYQCPSTQDPNSYDLRSPGPDGIEGTEDDIDIHTTN